MDTRTGDLYPNKQAALDAGVAAKDLVEVVGPPKAVKRLRAAVRKVNQIRKVKRAQQQASRKRNRR